MRIAFIGSRGFPGFNAGVEKSLEEVCPRLAARGHEITLYCSESVATDERIFKGVILKRTPAIHTKHLETLTRTVVSAWDALLKPYDIVHFHSIGPALFSWITRLGRSKTVVTVHGLDWQRAKWGLAARMALQAGERASVLFPHRTVVISKHLQRHYLESYRNEVTFIANGVTPEEPAAPRLIREKWGLSGGDYILFASRLVPEKECHTLIRAFQKVKTGKKLLIAGASWHSDDYVAKLREMAGENPDIIFAGWAEGELLRELFSNAYLYCLPSQIEGLSLSLLEAMSFGVCPLVSDIPENTDVVEENGVSFRVADADDLRARLQELCDDPETVARLGRQAGRAVREQYSWDLHARMLEETYVSLLNGKKAGAAV